MKKRTPIKISRQTHWKIVLLLVLAIVVLAIVSQVVAVRPWTGGRQAERGARSGGSPETDPEILACPFFANDEFVVRCPEGRYTMLYDTAYRQAAWVAYLLTRRDVSGKGVKRSGVFKSDPEVIARGWPSAADRDYTGSGFDRGHLLPSADRERYPAGERGYVPFVERFAAAAGTEPRDVAQAGRTGAALGGALRFALHRDRRRTDPVAATHPGRRRDSAAVF